MKEVHLFIIWENARDKEKEILEDIKQNFNIIGLYDITWNKDKFSENLSRFYGTNLPKNSGKEQHCGNGNFLLVIVEVENPTYEKRDTSKGIQTVNVEMFDKKTYYRELTGGGHKIHATNSEEETNHDLCLLLGKNINDYVKDFNPNQEIKPIEWKKDLIGAEGFKNVEEMFYTLNNCIHYAILRNYETLPEEIYVNNHNDIDILCDCLENAVYVLKGEKVFPETYRIHYQVKVGDQFAYFDIRHIGDKYYSDKMEQDLLNNRIYQEKGFYTLNEEDYFYSLLYHALLHKPQLAKDYHKRLQKMKPKNETLETEEDAKNVLNQWLLEKGYTITKPIDKSVLFNAKQAQKMDGSLVKGLLWKTKEMKPIEIEAIQYIQNNTKEQYENILANDERLEILLALSNLRENIISWYPFEENSSILEIGANLGQITGKLCEKASKVVAFEEAKTRKEAIQKRHENMPNLEVVGDLKEITQTFDYITIIGIENITDDPEALLKELKNYCKPEGKLLLATDNPLGMKYFATTDSSGQTATNLVDKKLYQLEEWLEKIEKAGYKQTKVYYPMTDYQLTNVIYTDQKPLSKNNLGRNIVYQKEDTIKFLEQNKAYQELLKKDPTKAQIFINSFFFEIGKETLAENGISFVAFSNMRKPPYRIQTVMKEKAVYKYPATNKSKEHIQQIGKHIEIMKQAKLKTLDTYDGQKIISQYSEEKTLDKVILELVKHDKNQAIQMIQTYQQDLKQKLEKGSKQNNVFDRYGIFYESSVLETMNFIKNGLWDLIFQNCFYIEDEFYFYDQEWKEENLPIEFIFYRAIKYFDNLKESISEKELFEILGLNPEIIGLLEQLDNQIQEKLRDKTMWKLNTQGKMVLDLKREKLTNDHQINLLKQENNQKDIEIQNLKKELENIYQSRSWKLTEPFRNRKNKK